MTTWETSQDPVIDLSGLTKSFGSTVALADLNLAVGSGQVHGFLGPNGAGKTTTLRIMLGLLSRDGGHAQVFGLEPWAQSVSIRRRLAYVPGEVALWPNLSGGESIDYLTRLRGGSDRARIEQLVHRFDLNPRVKVSSYSKGNRQKVALIAALACDVELYIFDEPTDGLDPLMGEVFREEVAALQTQGKTVLLSSHVLAEVDAVCDHVTIIRNGRTIETGALSDLRHLQRQSLVIETEHPLVGVENLTGVFDVEQNATTLRCTVEPRALSEVLRRATEANVVNLETRPPSLEEMFLRYYDQQEASAP
jgi:ABC-2 type transport system ATP-binding protein